MKLDSQSIYNLLPAVYRVRDAEQGEALCQLLEVLFQPIGMVSENIEQLYDDAFIETCAEWAIAYIGNLIGATHLHKISDATYTMRAQVARTLAYRRRKGTAGVIEEIAQDVTNWSARVVEYFQLLAITQNLNHQIPNPTGLLDLHERELLEQLASPFESAAYLAQLRPTPGGGRYNIPDIGIALFRAEACAFIDTDPAQPFNDYRYRFNPMDRDTALYNLPLPEEELSHIAQPEHVACPIERLVFQTNRARLFGRSLSLSITENGLPLTVDDILAANLSDRPDGSWGPRHATLYKVDPVLGRFMAPISAGTPQLTVSYHTGCLRSFGGGSYERSSSLDECQDPAAPPLPVIPINRPNKNLQPILDSAAGACVIEIADSATYPGNFTLRAAPRACVEFRAADQQRPYLPGSWVLSGGKDSRVVLNGLVIAGNVTVPSGSGGPAELILRHCTLVPGVSSLVIEVPNTTVTIENCIVGRIRTENDVNLKINDSVVDAAAADSVAIQGLTDGTAAGILKLQSCTIIGKVHARQMEEASNVIFEAAAGGPDPWPGDASSSAVYIQRLQEGCVRFSYVPPGSHVPRRYACHPTEGREDWVRPVFVSLRYGDVGYAQLSRTCPPEITRGADDEAEMGVFHDLYQPQREANVRAMLQEYLRIGLEAHIFYAE